MMPLPRLTAASAVPTVRGIVNDLARLSNDAGPLSSSQNLKENLENLQAGCLQPVFLMDVALTSKLSPETATLWASVSDLLSQGKVSQVRVWDAVSPPVYRSGSPRPPVLIACMSSPPTEAESNGIRSACFERPVVLLGCDPGAEWSKALAAELLNIAWYVEVVNLPTLSPASLQQRWCSAPWNSCTELLIAHSLCSALDSQAKVFGMALEEELRSIKAKRALVQQRAAKVQRTGQVNAPELISDVRPRVQRAFNDFSQGASNRMQSQAAPQGSEAMRQVEASLQSLEELERTNTSNSTITTLPEATEPKMIHFLYDQLYKHCAGDLVAAKDLFAIVQKELDQTAVQVGAQAISWQCRIMDDQPLHRILETQLAFQRHYKGELPKKGFFEYFMSARRYLTIMFMMFSAFGLSFLRGYKEFMIPASILLLGIGSVLVARSVKKERIEGMEKELEKARELIRGEARRMLGEVQRSWTSLLDKYLAEQQQEALTAFESRVRDYASRAASDTSEERQRVQRQLQGLDMAERRLQPLVKSQDSIVSVISQMRGEFRQLLLSSLKVP